VIRSVDTGVAAGEVEVEVGAVEVGGCAGEGGGFLKTRARLPRTLDWMALRERGG